jgi:predicted TIM-barrel fold metal-dependent hydrolase
MSIDCCCTIGGDNHTEPSADMLLTAMDNADVDRAVIHPPAICYAWENESGNDFILQAVIRHPDRFIPTATVNPWRHDAWEIIKKYIDAGAKMLTFSPQVQGFNVSGDKLDPVLEKMLAKGFSIPVYVHTGHYSFSAPSQLALLAKRFGKLNFIMGHSGSTDYKSDTVPVCSVCDNIYPESSFARPQSFVEKAEKFGFERAVMGSGFPYNQLEFEFSEMRRLLPKKHSQAVLGGNLVRLLEQ